MGAAGKYGELLRELACRVAGRLREAGYEVYFAGGCVRDRLLGNEPKDYDIATSARPEEVTALFEKTDAVGAHFGVILVKVQGVAFEVATFRTDGSYADGRRPESVEFATAQEDALRRDFTVNGLFEDPETGEVVDYVGGQKDLEAGILRAIGVPAERFGEDALRLMRAVRFAVRLGFELEAGTWAAVKLHAANLQKVSIERVQQEFSKILLCKGRRRGVELLVESGLMQVFLPEFMELIGCEQPPQFHPEGDVYTHTCIMLEMLEGEPSLELCLAVLLHDIGKPPTYSYDEQAQRIRFSSHDAVGAEMSQAILSRMKYPKVVIGAVVQMVEHHMRFMHVRQMRTAKLKRMMSRTHFEDEMELHRVDCASSNGISENYDFIREKQQEFAAEPLMPEPLLKGKDLIDRGMQPGPAFRKILNRLQTEQLEGRLKDRASALAWLRAQGDVE